MAEVHWPTRVAIVDVRSKTTDDPHPIIQIAGDKQLGHDLALALIRMEQTTIAIPESLRDLRFRLDAALVGDPTSRAYVKRSPSAEV